MNRVVAACSFAAILWQLSPGWAQAPPTAEQVHFFETSIRPLLSARCFKCHGPAKERGDLRLDSRERLLKGGEAGPVVEPGDPEKSLLIHAVRRTEKLKMPPDKALSDSEIDDLVRWVRMGVPYPPNRSAKTDEKSSGLWAFQPIGSPALPAVKDSTWPTAPLDHLILAGLEAKGLKPAKPADRNTLLRRATFDLTGLPPTPEEIDAFLADSSPDAFAKVVDRLLASPSYGERWGRHWLDLARYADSCGHQDNMVFGNAWRYRDYVIAAFNQDKPYNRFVLEQLAGDLLPDDDSCLERLIATGFLALGPKVLNELDEKKMEMDIIDEQIDTVGRTFLALTLGCARCHDHKSDPIAMEDYYGLAGIFKSTRTMNSYTRNSLWRETPLPWPAGSPTKLKFDTVLAQLRAAIDEFVEQADADVTSAVRRCVGNFVVRFFTGCMQLEAPRGDGPSVSKWVPNFPHWPIWLCCAVCVPAGLRLLAWIRSWPNATLLAVLVKYLLPAGLGAWMLVEFRHDVSQHWPHTSAQGEPVPSRGLESLYPPQTRIQLKQLRAQLARLEAEAVDFPTAMGACEGPVADAAIYVAGSGHKTGEIVPRCTPKSIASIPAPSFSAQKSGRLELARWLIDPDHPLTSRVLVNRVWRWHFGHGLVRTPDNFGRLGERPDNAALLDWLARQFIAGGWSIKALHRAIMNSSTYQMSSVPEARGAELDPENRLWGRANTRRLEVEAIRDSLLAITGALDCTMGGSLLNVKNREPASYIAVRGKSPYESKRRALYLPVIRNSVYDMFQLFDFPDPGAPNGDRTTTTFASQALFFMNSEWVAGLCQDFADKLLAAKDLDDAGRIGRVCRLAYGRDATAHEVASAKVFLSEVEAGLAEREAGANARRRRAWAALCQVVMAANEFLYVK